VAAASAPRRKARFAFVGRGGFGYNSDSGRRAGPSQVCLKESTLVQIKISIRHGSVSEETQSRIRTKVERLTRLFDRLTAIEVTIDLERRDQPGVDLRVSAEHKHDFVAAHRSEDLLGSVDQVVHKLEQQLRKYKQKIQDHHRSPANRRQEVHSDSEPGGN
jgi:putative sigma-54 modulation protein